MNEDGRRYGENRHAAIEREVTQQEVQLRGEQRAENR